MSQTEVVIPSAASSERIEALPDLVRYVQDAPKHHRFPLRELGDGRVELRVGTETLLLVDVRRLPIADPSPIIDRALTGQQVVVLVGREAELRGVEALRERGLLVTAVLPAQVERLIVDLRNAAELSSLRRVADERARTADRYRYEVSELIEISRAIGSERDVRKLLSVILEKCRQITGADAGSLYILESEDRHADQSQKKLRFILSQNDSLQIDFREFSLPVDAKSIVGASVLARRPINIRDLYRLEKDTNPWGFRHDKSFDQKTGYQTRSILTVPMFNHSDEVIGVVQLINKKGDPSARLKSDEDFGVLVVPFDLRSEELARSLAYQAGISLENALLYDEMRRVFEGFVRASVTAIESRDPTTSGHSTRVAELTVGLAATVDGIHSGEFADIHFSKDDLVEIEYAALLHDFGKVGVREHVLVKGKKLYEHQRELVEWRFDFVRKMIELEGTRAKLDLVLAQSRDEAQVRFGELDAQTNDRLRELDDYLGFVLKANEPTVLAEGSFERLQEIANRIFPNPKGQPMPLLCAGEVEALKVPRGSLTDDERKEIESHVVHTYNFLKKIPWGRQFKDVPLIAGAHHEKLDGSGYPHGVRAEAIPLESRMMTIADIFDALTASDRPYKKAVPTDRALSIIESEVKSGKCDAALFKVFVEAGVFKRAFSQ